MPTRKSMIALIIMAIVMISPIRGVFAGFETEKGWDGHLFPSYIIATATSGSRDADDTDDEDDAPAKEDKDDDDDDDPIVLGDQRGLLGITIEAESDEQQVKVTITCDAIMQPSVFSGTLPKSGKTYTINPRIKYKFDELAKRGQTGPITVTYAVEIDDGDAEETTETLTLRSINDCPYSVKEDDEWHDVRFMFAAYVNEQHPFVDKILREALDTQVVDSFAGYQSKKATEVYRQAYALWHALSQRDVRYSSITKTVALQETVGSQHVRLIDESINNGQANCLDGSVLMASLLRKVTIEPMLVHIPGHCFLAFFLDEDGKELSCLETTMIGLTIDGDAMKVTGLEDVVNNDFKSENSWKTFSAAIAKGTATYKKYEKNFKDAKDHNYQLISIAAARKSGILPIGFQSNQKFTSSSKNDGKESSE